MWQVMEKAEVGIDVSATRVSICNVKYSCHHSLGPGGPKSFLLAFSSSADQKVRRCYRDRGAWKFGGFVLFHFDSEKMAKALISRANKGDGKPGGVVCWLCLEETLPAPPLRLLCLHVPAGPRFCPSPVLQCVLLAVVTVSSWPPFLTHRLSFSPGEPSGSSRQDQALT